LFAVVLLGCSGGPDEVADASAADAGAVDGVDDQVGITADAVDDAAGPPSWTEIKPATAPSPRTVHRMAYDPGRERIVLVAGQPGDQALPLGDIWEWDGTDWSELKPVSGVALPIRKNFGMAYDSVRKRLVVFAGIKGGLSAPPETLGDTWEWDGESWVERKPPSAPSPRAGHAMAYDPARKRVVVFGGMDDKDQPRDDTWEWDGSQWSEVTPAGDPPPARFNTAMVYHGARERIVLFGGQTHGSPKNLNDLWEWDGRTWTQLDAAGKLPMGRGFHALAYDSARERLVLYGGAISWPPIPPEHIFGDHWEWDGEAWTRIGDNVGPKQRVGQALVYDPKRARLVLFGGKSTLYSLQDTWEYGR
jgi:hypothetical protein